MSRSFIDSLLRFYKSDIKIDNIIDEKEIKNIIAKKYSVKDPITGKVWMIRNNGNKGELKLQSERVISQGLYRAINIYIDNFSDVDEDNINSLLFLLELHFSNFIDDDKYEKVKEFAFKYIKEIMANSNEDEKEKNYDNIVSFFNDSRSNIPNKSIILDSSNEPISIKRQKELRRAFFIADMLKSGIIDFDLLFKSGEILEFDFDQFDNAFRKQRLLSREELIRSCILNKFADNEHEVLYYYYENDKKYFFEIANTNDLVHFLLGGYFENNPKTQKQDVASAVKKMQIREMALFEPDLMEDLLSIENLPKNSFITRNKEGSFISRNLMLQLKRETLLRLLYSEKIKYKNSLSSDDLVNLYGKLNFVDLEGLNKYGFVNSEDVIKIIKFYNIEENKNYFKYNLIGFYNLDKLEEMINENRINKKFMENFSVFSDEILNEEERKEYFRNLTEDLKQKENRDELVVALAKNGFNFGRIEGYQMDSEKVSDMYLNDEITENEMLKLYGMGVVPLQTIREFFGSDDEIIKSYEEGNLDISALSLIENNNYFRIELEAGRLTIKDIMELYSIDGGLEEDSLDEILDGMDLTQIGIGRYLPDTISPEKVEALFRGYYISQDELGELVGRGIITDEQADQYAKELATHKEYESIFSGRRVVVLTKETEGEKGLYTPTQLGGTGGASRKNQVKIDPFFQERLLKNIGFDNRRLVLEGYNNSLNGYIVYPSEELGVMVFFNPNKPSNATYIMTIQQAMYFLKRSGRQSGKNTIESAATKQDLRETEHVKVKNACRGWGKNIIDTIKKLSPEMAQRLKDNQYKEKLDAIVSEIKTDYDRRR